VPDCRSLTAIKSVLVRALFAELFQDGIPPSQYMFPDQDFDLIRIAFAHEFDHLNMVLIADNGELVVL
jgi:hypothetical protein